jgi:hypothetical protein
MENTGIVPTLPVGGNGLGFGGDGIWALLIFAMIFNGGFGFGNGNNVATTDFVSNEFTQRDIAGLGTEVNNGFQNTNNLITAGLGRINDNLYGINNAVLENRYTNQLAEAQTQRDILMQTTQIENQASINALQNMSKMDECCCAIKNAIREDGEKTRALITANTIQDLRDRLQEAQNTITASGIGNYIVGAIRPFPVPAWTVQSPYVSVTPATTTQG